MLGPHATSDFTPVTDGQMDSFRDETSAQINVVLESVGVAVVPVTDHAAFQTYLGAVEAWGTAAQVLKAMFPEAMGPGEQPAYAFWDRKYRDALVSLSRSQHIPPNLFGEDRPVPSSYFTKHPEDEAQMGALAGASAFVVDNLNQSPW